MIDGCEGGAGAARRVAFVDDEIGPIRFADIPDSVQEFLSDSNSPEIEELWAFGVGRGVLQPLTELSLTQIQRSVESSEFLNDILMSEEFFASAKQSTQAKLVNIRDQRHKFALLLNAIRDAFPSPEFEVICLSERPSAAVLLDYDFLILDLVMDNGSPVEEVSNYLKALSDAAGESRPIPPILLVSLRADDLDKGRLTFRTAAQISAAGLSIFSKQSVVDSHFNSSGLRLLWQQMYAQRDAAAKIRILCRAWDRALEASRRETAETLWNLDAAALQQIHLTSVSDNDPFDEHLHDLISREHVWHLEKDMSIRAAVDELDKIYEAKLDRTTAKAKIGYRFSAHSSADMVVMRRLEEHFYWFPYHPSRALESFRIADHAGEFNRFLPFGVVLTSKDFAQSREVLIHLTQQCDLNKRTPFDRDISLIFVRAKAVDSSQPTNEESACVVKEMRLDSRTYDLNIFPHKPVAIPANRFIRFARQGVWRSVARVRPDIARQILQVVANNATRLAAFSTTRGYSAQVRVCLRIGLATGQPRDIWYEGVDSFQEAKSIVANVFEEKFLSYLDDESFNLGIWVMKYLTENGSQHLMPNLSAMCDKLRLGLTIGLNRNPGALEPLKCEVLRAPIGLAEAEVLKIPARLGSAAFIAVVEGDA